MINSIIERFEKVNETYGLLVDNSEEIFLSLKHKKLTDVDFLNKKRNMLLGVLEEKMNQLKDEIVSACQSFGTELGIRSLEPYMGLAEKEKVSACQRTAFHFEKKLKNNTKMNQCLVEAMLNASQTIVDTWVYVANQEKKTNAFLNKRF